jgi:hypothetical protein
MKEFDRGDRLDKPRVYPVTHIEFGFDLLILNHSRLLVGHP